MVLSEGKSASSADDFKYLRKENTLEARRQAADGLLQKGTISAVDYIDLATDLDFRVAGIEDMDLYTAHMRAHVGLFNKEKEASETLVTLQATASSLKPRIYSEEMLNLDHWVLAHNDDRMGLGEYVERLEGAATAHDVRINRFPNVALFLEAVRLEHRIRFISVDTEREAVIAATRKALACAGADMLAEKTRGFTRGDIPEAVFYSYLMEAAEEARVDVSTLPNLVLYTHYLAVHRRIDSTLLFWELDALADEIRNAAVITLEQKTLAAIDTWLGVLLEAVRTRLVPGRYAFLQQNRAQLDLKGWCEFLEHQAARWGLAHRILGQALIRELSRTLQLEHCA